MSDTEKTITRPVSFDTYVGQEKLKRRLRVDIDAAVRTETSLRHYLFTGPAGAGKTSLAWVVANELGDDIIEITMPVEPDDFARILRDSGGVGILLLDEIHATPKPIQTSLLMVMEAGMFGDRHGRRIDTSRLTVIGATTDPQELLRPLYSRFIVPTFEPYTDDEMTRIVQGVANKLGVTLPPETVASIAGAAGGVPRTARDLVFTARNMLLSNDVMPSAAEIFELAQVTSDGLDDRHMQYLKILGDCNGRASLELLTNLLNMHSSFVRGLETPLVTKGLIELRPGGRELTRAGWERSPSARAVRKTSRLARTA